MKEVYDIFLNGKFHKTYNSLRGVKIAYGKLDKKINTGEVPITVPAGDCFLAWHLREVGKNPVPADTHFKASYIY